MSDPSIHTALMGLVLQATANLRPGDLRSGDLRGTQRVADYQVPANQWRYTHMYAAKHTTAWGLIRRKLGWSDLDERPLVSIGAGPLLCLAGWLQDAQHHGAVIAIDALDWSAVTESIMGKVLRTALGNPTLCSHRYVPAGLARPPQQLSRVRGVSELDLSLIPDGATVLMPMMLNHLLINNQVPVAVERALRDTLHSLQQRGCRVVIADVHTDYHDLWPALSRALRLRHVPPLLRFADHLRAHQGLYCSREHGQIRTSPAMGRLRVVANNGSHWKAVCA